MTVLYKAKENFRNFFKSQAKTYFDNGKIGCALSNLKAPFFNSILDFDPSLSKKELQLELNDVFQKYGSIPFSWFVNSSTAPIWLKEFILSNALQEHSQFDSMILELDKYSYQMKSYENYKIITVSTPSQLDCWINLFKAFGLCDSDNKKICQKYKEFLTSSNQYKHFIAYYNDVPVGIATLFFTPYTAGLYNLAVSTEYRNKGFGTALQHHRVMCAIENGCKYAIMQSNPLSGKIARRLGFTKRDTYTAYVYNSK